MAQGAKSVSRSVIADHPVSRIMLKRPFRLAAPLFCALWFGSPAITAAILEGRQPPELTLHKLLQTPIPLDWDRQAKVLGFAFA